MTEEKCICCDNIVPEGRQVCPKKILIIQIKNTARSVGRSWRV